MNTIERDKILFRVNAAWEAMPDAMLAVWAEELGPMDPLIAQKAISRLIRTKTFRPSIAELHEAYGAAKPTEVTRAIEPTVDVSGQKRIAELIASMKGKNPITAKMLDERGVKNWRQRLRDAVLEDHERQTNRAHYDLAWAQVREEYLNDRATVRDAGA